MIAVPTCRAHGFRVCWLLGAQSHAKVGEHRYGRFCLSFAPQLVLILIIVAIIAK
jgi:hypothetical protein